MQQRIVLYLVLSLSLFLSSIYLDVIEYETRLVSPGLPRRRRLLSLSPTGTLRFDSDLLISQQEWRSCLQLIVVGWCVISSCY